MPVAHEDRREYRAAYIRQHYAENKAYYIERAAARKLRMAAWFTEYKSTLACVECGEDHPATLDFHHRDPSTKEANVSSTHRLGWSEKRILKEIAKCDVLCANCHRKLHYEGE
jgi:hypothetical protein